MKRIIITLLVVLVMMTAAACRNQDEKKDVSISAETVEATATDTTEEGKDAASPMITDEIKTLFTALNKKQASDAELTPVALVSAEASGVGTDFLILCKMKSGSLNQYALVTVREENNEPGVLTISKCGLSAPEPYDPENPVSGGWGEPESPALTDAVKLAVEKACKELDDKSYEPIAYVGMQVVAGYNYHVLCRDASSDKPSYVILEIYSDLDGNAEITQTYPFSE